MFLPFCKPGRRSAALPLAGMNNMLFGKRFISGKERPPRLQRVPGGRRCERVPVGAGHKNGFRYVQKRCFDGLSGVAYRFAEAVPAL